MRITIVSATEVEILPSIRFLSGKGFDFQGNKFQLLVTGVGMMATAYSLTRHVILQEPHLLIQAGIAGSFSLSHPPLTTVIVKEEFLGDLGVEEAGSFKDIFDLQLADDSNFPFVQKRLTNPNIDKWEKYDFKPVRGLTVNEISTNPHRIETLKIKYDPIIESMEGASFHYIGLQEKIPFVQLRTVSNFVGERDKTKWKLHESIMVLNEALIKIIQDTL